MAAFGPSFPFVIHGRCPPQYEATVENIVDAAWRLRDDYDLPENWQYEVYGWLSDHECSEIECCGDQVGYALGDGMLFRGELIDDCTDDDARRQAVWPFLFDAWMPQPIRMLPILPRCESVSCSRRP
ncbi:hypothetical protein [Blastopirellula retiformator]|uniref:hypothetical protein n=1 Tax=Blastopirellula retiformator TaxID=2527970 RepID=UPI0011B54541|nr:hypothetical protein [Blastopirellula retiformator]